MNQLSVMIGDKPTGLAGFIATARPRGVYCLNTRVRANWPALMTVFRVQNAVDGKKGGWGRQPEACATPAYWLHTDPVASARWELLTKTTYVPKRGNLNLIQYWQLSNESWYAPVNEPDLGEGADRFDRARWWAAWFTEAITIAREAGLSLCLGSFPTGTPTLDVLPIFAPVFELLKACGGIIDLHEYGVEGRMMDQGHRSGALRYREFYHALPIDSRCDLVISEFWSHSGFTDAGDWQAQVNDAIDYGAELAQDPYVLFACAFQLDQGKESNIVPKALDYYAQRAAQLVTPPPPPDPRYVVTTGPLTTAQTDQLKFYLDGHALPYTVTAK